MVTSDSHLLKIGGYCGVCFAIIWIICGTGYLIVFGIPSSVPSLLETARVMSQPSFKILFWIWPVAYLAVIPFALAVRIYLKDTAPIIALIGTAFLLLYACIWFVWHGSMMASTALASQESFPENEFAAMLTLVGTLGSPLFWSITISLGSWSIPLLKRIGMDRISGIAFMLGSFSSLAYFIMRYTGPFRTAEIVHELLILFMIIGVGSLGLSMIKASKKPK